MTTATGVIVEHLEAVKAAFALAPGPSAAWLILLETCPQISASMSQNTFRATAPVVLGTAARLADPTPPPAPEPPPKTFAGWTVGVDAKGFIRLHRKVAGRLFSVYIGKSWDADKAKAKIEEFGQRVLP